MTIKLLEPLVKLRYRLKPKPSEEDTVSSWRFRDEGSRSRQTSNMVDVSRVEAYTISLAGFRMFIPFTGSEMMIGIKRYHELNVQEQARWRDAEPIYVADWVTKAAAHKTLTAKEKAHLQDADATMIAARLLDLVPQPGKSIEFDYTDEQHLQALIKKFNIVSVGQSAASNNIWYACYSDQHQGTARARKRTRLCVAPRYRWATTRALAIVLAAQSAAELIETLQRKS